MVRFHHLQQLLSSEEEQLFYTEKAVSSSLTGATMNIKTRKSKWWKLWNWIFPKADLGRIYITFGPTVWTPGYISEDIAAHEQIHVLQQKGSYIYAVVWWIKYLLSKKFRYSQEIEAYRFQLQFLKENVEIKDKNERVRMHRAFEQQIAQILSSPMYNHMVSYAQAIVDLRKSGREA